MFIVYKYTSPSGKVYIGKTSAKREKKRKYEHEWESKNKKSNRFFHNAINKYGFELFNYEVLAYVATEETAFLMEEALIKQFKSNDRKFGYNSTNGGEGLSGYKASESTRKLMSEQRKGRKLSAETIEKITAFHTGRKRSEETRKKISDKAKGREKDNQRLLDYWANNCGLRTKFKRACSTNGWNFEDFSEIFNGDIYTKPDGRKEKKYYYKLK